MTGNAAASLRSDPLQESASVSRQTGFLRRQFEGPSRKTSKTDHQKGVSAVCLQSSANPQSSLLHSVGSVKHAVRQGKVALPAPPVFDNQLFGLLESNHGFAERPGSEM